MQDSLMCHVEEGKIEEYNLENDSMAGPHDEFDTNRKTNMTKEYYISELQQPFGVAATHNDLNILSNSMENYDEDD